MKKIKDNLYKKEIRYKNHHTGEIKYYNYYYKKVKTNKYSKSGSPKYNYERVYSLVEGSGEEKKIITQKNRNLNLVKKGKINESLKDEVLKAIKTSDDSLYEKKQLEQLVEIELLDAEENKKTITLNQMLAKISNTSKTEQMIINMGFSVDEFIKEFGLSYQDYQKLKIKKLTNNYYSLSIDANEITSFVWDYNEGAIKK